MIKCPRVQNPKRLFRCTHKIHPCTEYVPYPIPVLGLPHVKSVLGQRVGVNTQENVKTGYY